DDARRLQESLPNCKILVTGYRPAAPKPMAVPGKKPPAAPAPKVEPDPALKRETLRRSDDSGLPQPTNGISASTRRLSDLLSPLGPRRLVTGIHGLHDVQRFFTGDGRSHLHVGAGLYGSAD